MTVTFQWARGYARQADADLRAWELYQKYPEAVSTRCHTMLFLQMACEKFCKAHLLRTGGLTHEQARKSHGFVKRHLPEILKQEIAYRKHDKLRQMRMVMTEFRHLAQEIEVLNPSMNLTARPENCEYPWDNGGGVVLSPLDYTFIPQGLLLAPSGVTFLKLLRQSINRLLSELP